VTRPKVKVMRRPGIWALIIVILLLGCFISGFVPWPQDHRFDEKNLVGLTVNDVIQRFGKPDYDNRVEVTEEQAAQGRAVAIAYFRHWHTYLIKLRDGRVIAVELSMK